MFSDLHSLVSNYNLRLKLVGEIFCAQLYISGRIYYGYGYTYDIACNNAAHSYIVSR